MIYFEICVLKIKLPVYEFSEVFSPLHSCLGLKTVHKNTYTLLTSQDFCPTCYFNSTVILHLRVHTRFQNATWKKNYGPFVYLARLAKLTCCWMSCSVHYPLEGMSWIGKNQLVNALDGRSLPTVKRQHQQ